MQKTSRLPLSSLSRKPHSGKFLSNPLGGKFPFTEICIHRGGGIGGKFPCVRACVCTCVQGYFSVGDEGGEWLIFYLKVQEISFQPPCREISLQPLQWNFRTQRGACKEISLQPCTEIFCKEISFQPPWREMPCKEFPLQGNFPALNCPHTGRGGVQGNFLPTHLEGNFLAKKIPCTEISFQSPLHWKEIFFQPPTSPQSVTVQTMQAARGS